MPEKTKQSDILPPEVYKVVHTLVTAIRIVELYPPNNPVYSKTVKDAHEELSRFLEKTPECYFGIQKTFFTYLQTPVGKDIESNKSTAQDLFAKGIRDITFCSGLTAEEMLAFFQTIALPKEEIAMKRGISSILWEKGVSNIKVTESELEGVITAKTEGKREEGDRRTSRPDATDSKSAMSAGRTLVLDDLMTDPASFSADMVELAKKTKGENETVEDRLIILYKEAAHKIQEEHQDESDAHFMALAQSLLSLEQPYRETLIVGKLYADMDSKNVEELKAEIEEQLPSKLHEILTGRFSKAWAVQQVADLLKRSVTKEITPITPLPSSPSILSTMSLPSDLGEISKEMSQYTAAEKEELNAMSNAGVESDDIDAAVKTLIALLPLVKNSHHAVPDEMEITRFDSVIRQLEDMLSYLLKKQDYKRVSLITNAFNAPVDPAFKPRMLEALKKTSSKDFIISIIADLQNYTKGSSEYVSAYSYLSAIERETTEVLLEMLANETDKTTKAERTVIIDLLKDIGKNQIALMGEYLSDDRWHFVSSILNILSEIKSDQVIVLLQKAASNKNAKIRHEAIKILLSIGGDKTAGLLAKFLKDEDEAIQRMAIRGFTELKGISAENTKPLITFLHDRPVSKKELPLTLEAIKALEKVGGPAAEDLLKIYTKFKWWKSWELQKELKTAAQRAMTAIKRRQVDGGSAKR